MKTSPSLSPDGSSVVYEAGPPGNSDIYLQRVGGHNPINLTKDCEQNDSQPAFSPSGDRIAFRSECGGGGIFIMGATGESIRRLSDFGSYPSWSPDEKEIAVATEVFVNPYSRAGLSGLWAIQVANGTKRQIQGSDCMQPSWSPHGTRIAYWGLVGNTSQRDIFTAAAVGDPKTPPVAVTDDPPLDWSPFWSADGKFLYFASDRGGSMNLWRVAIDERTGKTLGPLEPATLPAGWAGPVSESRDGRHIVYEALTRLPGIQRIPFDPAAGSVTGQAADIFRGSLPMLPFEVSPDGGWIVFASSGARQDLFLMRSDGTGLRQITDDPYRDRNVAWSRDGKQILFMSDRGKSGYETWSIHPDGSGLTQVTRDSKKGTWWPVFSPDGTRFAAGDGESAFIYPFSGAAAGKPERLPPLEPGYSFNVRDWSPDGTTLLGARYSANRGEGVVLYDLASRKYRRLNDSADWPRFLPDGRRILYVADHASLWLIDAQTKETRMVLPPAKDSEILHFAVAPDGRSLYVLRQLLDSDLWEADLKP